MQERYVIHSVQGYRTIDGAGVNLVRVLGNTTAKLFDPILMLDSFDSIDPKEYIAGFPMHPHRGIETISYIASGKMQHRDSIGSSDTVESGEVQWMTAGSGIMHEERIPPAERLLGVQLWLNLPSQAKMTSPSYHAIKQHEIPEIPLENGTLRILAGCFGAHRGYQSRFLPLDYYEIQLNANAEAAIETVFDASAMLFTLEGSVSCAGSLIPEKTAAKLSEGELLRIQANDSPARVLFISSKPLQEPIAWGGPIVMNTPEELQEAMRELRSGTFIKEEIKER